MGYFYIAVSPCQFTVEQRRKTERDYPGLEFPDEGRLPSRHDFEAIFVAHPEWQVVFDQRSNWWTAVVRRSSQSAYIEVNNYSGDPVREQEFYFESGDTELVLEIADALAERCGPFLIAGEGGDIIVMVNPDGSRSDVGVTPAGGSRPATRPQQNS